MKRKFVLAALFAATLMMGFVSCKDDEEDPKPEPEPTPVVEKEFTVKFDANGGTGSAADAKVKEGQEATLPATGITREGYTFKGWSESKDGAVVTSFKPTADATLYAVWEQNETKPEEKPNDNPATDLAYDTPKTITWTQLWAGPAVQVEADWVKVTVVFEEKPEGVQFCVSSDFVASKESWGDAYQATYPPIAEATASVDIAAELATMQAKEGDGSTKITTITLQNTEDTSNKTAKLKAFIVTLKDGSQKLVVPEFPGWGGKIE